MAQYPRYAIYFLPPADSSLYRFGASLLGYDAYTGKDLPFADGIADDVHNWKDLTADPRKYGFHATLKAPISLAPGKTEYRLKSALRDFALISRTPPVIVPVVCALGDFVAVVPDAPSPALQQLAAACVTAFDAFRAPLAAEDRKRRNVDKLTETQVAYLDRWGYPYVFEDFRFHMTLTGPLPTNRREHVLEVLQQRFAALALQIVAIDRVVLLRQDSASSRFVAIQHAEISQDISQDSPAPTKTRTV